MYKGFGLVARAAGWHTGDPGWIPGRDGLNLIQINSIHFIDQINFDFYMEKFLWQPSGGTRNN
jgi:hypothetical protein